MKVRVTNKVKGEIVIPCLGGSLKRGDSLNIDAYKSSHQDVLWALHHGYLEIIDKNQGEEPMGDVVCFTNVTNRTLTGRMFSKPLDPSRSIVIKKSDPLYVELSRMVDSGKLKVQSHEESPSVRSDFKESEVTVSENLTKSSNKDSEAKYSSNDKVKSFKKKSNGKTKSSLNNSSKEKVETKNQDILSPQKDKVSATPKLDNGATVLQSEDIIFADMNGEVT